MSKYTKTICLVDDDPNSLQGLSFLLGTLCYHVAPFSSPRDALDWILAFPPHLVITDFAMPGMNGISLYEKIKEKHPRLPVIMISAHGSGRLKRRAHETGISFFLEKPIDSSLLRGTLRELLEGNPEDGRA